MILDPGILFALIAFVCWGFGDFLIQRSTRKFGDWETLFAISLFGFIVLTPIVYHDLSQVFHLDTTFWILMGASIVLFVAALFDFEALRLGKLSIVEPVLALEVPFSAILAFFVLRESLGIAEIAVISVIMVGIMLISFKSTRFSHKLLLEKGVLLGAAGAFFMGASNFLVGYGSRVTNPLIMNWFLSFILTIIPLSYMLLSKSTRAFFSQARSNKGFIATLCLLDNGAWVAYAFAASMTPIAIVVAISESYIGLTVLLGILINKESVHTHQKIGMALALLGVVALSLIVG